jgi:hypothetical protein
MVASTITADLAIGMNRDVRLMIARGDIAGAKPYGAYGERLAGAGETDRVIWPNGVFTLPDATGVQMTLVSTSADDDKDAGTGARSVEIHYLDDALVEQKETVLLEGTVAVTTVATNIRFINCIHIRTYGTFPAAAAGTITASHGGVTYGQINTGAVRCTSSARMVPAGKRCFVAGAVGGAASGTAAAGVVIRLVASELDTDQFIEPFILFPFGSLAVQDGSDAYTFPLPLAFSAGTVIAMTLTTDKAATVAGSWFGWLEDI